MNNSSSPSGTDTKNRHDVYGPVHKGLRKAQGELLTAIGCASFDDEAECGAVLGRLRQILELASLHLSHEDKFVRTAINERSDAGTEVIDAQHKEHRGAFTQFEDLATEIERATGPHRISLGRKLYTDLAEYMSEDLEHMNEEETETWPLLCSLYSDEELMQLEGQIIGSLTPEQSMAFMSIMIPAINKSQRGALLGGIKANAPAEAFNAIMEHAAQPNLSSDDFADLSGRLGL